MPWFIAIIAAMEAAPKITAIPTPTTIACVQVIRPRVAIIPIMIMPSVAIPRPMDVLITDSGMVQMALDTPTALAYELVMPMASTRTAQKSRSRAASLVCVWCGDVSVGRFINMLS